MGSILPCFHEISFFVFFCFLCLNQKMTVNFFPTSKNKLFINNFSAFYPKNKLFVFQKTLKDIYLVFISFNYSINFSIMIAVPPVNFGRSYILYLVFNFYH